MVFGFGKKKIEEEADKPLKYAVPESPVFKTWCMLILTSIVSLISIASQEVDTGHETWVAIATAVSLAVSLLMFFDYNLARERIKGSKTEGVIGIIILLFWVAAFPSIMELTIVTESNGVMSIVNANLYFSSWASFAVSCHLFVQIIPNLFGRFEPPEDAEKTSKMMGLLVTSIVLLVSAIQYHDDACSDSGGSTCSRNSASFAIGTIGIIIPAFVLVLTVRTRLNRLMEAIFSGVMLVVYIAGVAIVTFGKGAGSLAVSNLYFAPWVGFFIALNLTFETIKAFVNNRNGDVADAGEEEEEKEEEKTIISQEPSSPYSEQDVVGNDDWSLPRKIHGNHGHSYVPEDHDFEIEC